MKENNTPSYKRVIPWIGSITSAGVAALFFIIDFFEPAHKFTGFLSSSVLGVFLSITIDTYLKNKKDKENGKSHFPKSYPIVNEHIATKIHDKSQSDSYKETNNDIDKTIKSPLEYTHETLNGNQAPFFNPNEQYLEEIYSDRVQYIVAITAENPNLWLDPSLCFYMTNCCAVSLINHAKEHIGEKLTISDLNNDDEYLKFVKAKAEPVLQKLKEGKEPDSFEFIRFVIFTEEQKECLEQTVFPSLKASQDLFGIKSFFIQKDKIESKLGEIYTEYKGYVESIWNRIALHNEELNSNEIVLKRKKELIPEFLILFLKDKTVVIHTYINGKPYCVKLSNNKNLVRNDYEAVQSLIAYLADCRLGSGCCDWIPKTKNRNLNTSKSYLDWEVVT